VREKLGSYSGDALQISAVPELYGGHEAWLGGSIVASLPVFRELVVTKAQYDEVGPNIFDKRL
jgi:actin-related protein